MEYENEQFDVLLLFNVIENIPNLLEFLQAVKRSVKIGGTLSIIMSKWSETSSIFYRKTNISCFDRRFVTPSIIM